MHKEQNKREKKKSKAYEFIISFTSFAIFRRQ